MREADIQGLFQSLAEQLATRTKGSPDAWSDVAYDYYHSLFRLIDLTNQWHPGDAVPASLFVERHLESTIGGRQFASGDLLLGFVRLSTVTEASELRINIGGQDFGAVSLGPQAGAFTFAHAGKFVIPRISLSHHLLTALPCDDPSVGIVWGMLDSPERRYISMTKTYIDLGDNLKVWYYGGMGVISPLSPELQLHPDYPSVELPNIHAVAFQTPNARIIQRAWRAHAERRRRAAVQVIENAVIEFLYRPGGPMYRRVEVEWRRKHGGGS